MAFQKKKYIYLFAALYDCNKGFLFMCHRPGILGMALTLVCYTRVVGLCFLAPFWLQHSWPTFSDKLACACAVLMYLDTKLLALKA